MVETACVCEPRRARVCGTMRAGSVHTSAAPGNTAGLTCSSCFRKCAWTLSGNDDWNGHEQALSCCVYNYLCRHGPSLKKKSTEISSSMGICIWLLVDTYFCCSIFSLCGFLLPYLCPKLTILSTTLTIVPHYSKVTQCF